ncbi:unnamed protein product [Ectocarpus sp. 6 AP-2014]
MSGAQHNCRVAPTVGHDQRRNGEKWDISLRKSPRAASQHPSTPLAAPTHSTSESASMSKFFDKSPAKKQRPAQETASSGNGSGSGDSDGFKTVGEVFPGRVCPVPTCPTPKQLLVRYVNGRPFVVCSNQVKDDPTSCQFSANKFGKDRSTNKGKSSIACITCDVPVEFVLSIGKPNGEFHPTTGKPKYDNVHVYFDDCWGKRTNDPVTGRPFSPTAPPLQRPSSERPALRTTGKSRTTTSRTGAPVTSTRVTPSSGRGLSRTRLWVCTPVAPSASTRT